MTKNRQNKNDRKRQRRKEFLYGRNRETRAPIIVTGSIYLWGDVVEHEHGYRGEFAKV